MDCREQHPAPLLRSGPSGPLNFHVIGKIKGKMNKEQEKLIFKLDEVISTNSNNIVNERDGQLTIHIGGEIFCQTNDPQELNDWKVFLASNLFKNTGNQYNLVISLSEKGKEEAERIRKGR